MNESSFCSNFLPAFYSVNVLDFGHSDRYIEVSCCFSLHFPDDMIWPSFHMLICLLYILFGQCLLRSLAYFLNQIVFLLLSFKISLYILDNVPLSDVSFVNIFSQSMTCLFILLAMYFTEQKIFNFNEVQLINSSFYGSYLWCCI